MKRRVFLTISVLAFCALAQSSVVVINSFRFGVTTPLITNVQKLSLDPATSVGTRVDVSDGFYVSGFGDARDEFYFEWGTFEDAPRYIQRLPFFDDGTDTRCYRNDEAFWRIGDDLLGIAEATSSGGNNPWEKTFIGLTLTHPAHQQLNLASTAITGQFVSLAGTAEVNAVYTKRGTSGGKDYYNILGLSDDTTHSSISWGNLGGILGIGWGIYTQADGLIYYSINNVSRPDQVTTWTSITLDQVPTVTSVTTGDLAAGFKIGSDTFIVNGSLNGRNNYTDVLGMAPPVVWDLGSVKWWNGTTDLNLGNVPFPFSGTPEVTVTKSNVAAESNWGEVP